MNYRMASRQQLLAERARLTLTLQKAEQRLGPTYFTNAVGGGNTRRSRGSTRAPQNEVERLQKQLAEVEAEIKRRDAKEASPAPAEDEPGVE